MLINNFNPIALLNNSDPLALAKDFINRIKQIQARDAILAGTVLAIGLAALIFNHAFIGTAFTFYGMYRCYQILYPSQNRVREFLGEAQDRLNEIQQAVKGTSQTIDSIKTNCEVVQMNLTEMQKRLEEIQHLATNGNQELEKMKQEAFGLYQKSVNLFKQAEEQSSSSQAAIAESEKAFTDAFNQLAKFKNHDQISERDLKPQRERFNVLFTKCTIAQQKRKDHYQSLVHANDLYKQAFCLHTKASDIDKKAIIKSQEILQQIQRQAQIDQIKLQSRNALEEMKKECGILRKKADEEGKMIDQLRANLTQAENAAETQFGFKSVIFGGGGGAVIGALGGMVGAGAGAAAGAVAFHNRDKIGGLVIGNDPEAMPPKPSKEQPVTYAFNPKATGLLGRLAGRSSHTFGKVAIAIDEKESIELNFDLNSSHKIAHKDLRYLGQRITKNLELNPMLASYYLSILETLATIAIDRNHGSVNPLLDAFDPSHKPTVGFINSEEYLMQKLKACATQVQRGQEELQKLQASPAA